LIDTIYFVILWSIMFYAVMQCEWSLDPCLKKHDDDDND